MGGFNGSLDRKRRKKPKTKKTLFTRGNGSRILRPFETAMIVLCRDHEHAASPHVQLLHRSLSNVKLCH